MRKLCCSLLAFAPLVLEAGTAGEPGGDILFHSDGWEIHGDLQMVDAVAPAVLLLHDAAGNRGDFLLLAEALRNAGLHTLSLELRGHGASNNLGRFEPPYPEHLHINREAWHDIVVALRWLRQQPSVKGVGVVGASYSGEQAALALRDGDTSADAYVMLSPGDFQDVSMASIDPSGVPWLFLRTEAESPESLRWIDEVFASLPKLAASADIRIYPGSGHASKMLVGRPDLPAEIAQWLADALAVPP